MSAETVSLRAMTDADLAKELTEAHHALFNLRFQASTRQLSNTSQIEKGRRRVARVRTLIRERTILAELDSALAAVGNGE